MHTETILQDRHDIKNVRRVTDLFYSRVIRNEVAMESGLVSGRGGVVLALFVAYQATNNELYKQQMYKLLVHELELTKNEIGTCHPGAIDYTFFSGISGIAWLIKQLCVSDIITQDFNSIFSNQLIRETHRRCLGLLDEGNYDYWFGGLSLIPYLSLTSDADSIHMLRESLNTLMDRLDDKDTLQIWKYPAIHDRTTYNLGIPHGVPGVLLLARLAISKLGMTSSYEYKLRHVVNWILGQRKSLSNNSNFYSHSDRADEPSRLAWCYGDLAVSFALYKLSQTLNDSSLANYSTQLALETTSRIEEQSNGIVDAGFCHGTSGIAYLYNRFFILTGNTKFKTASIYWNRKTIDKILSKEKFESYKIKGVSVEADWEEDLGLIEGASGMIVTLLSSISQSAPSWDTALLLS